MNKTFHKNIFRTIGGSKGRYFAIMAIIALGVGFFAGLKVTKPGMIKTADTYMRDHKMYDFRLLSSYGFDEDEVTYMREQDYVLAAEGAYTEDFLYVNDEGTELVIKANSITNEVNTLELKAGRMPETDNECVLDAFQFDESMIGKEIRISEHNTEDVKESFKHDTYTVVGMVNTPVYINLERGTTSLGNGRLNGFIYIMPEGFNCEYYKEMYLLCQDSYEIYTDEYDDFIESISEIVKEDLAEAVEPRYQWMNAIRGSDIPLPEPQLYVLDRSSNTGYMCYDNDTNIVDGVARVFPIFFFLIAALVCSTTMTRMVDDERGQIGTFRALGYGNATIISKYMIYSGTSAIIGCVIGFFGGTRLFPYVIWKAYRILNNFGDGLEYYFSLPLLVICIAVSLICSMGTTYFACKNELKCMPAELIRPKAPAPGKRILLEHIRPVWRRMRFLHKVTARNVFRFKKRMLMMVVGIAGCTALVLTGLGVRDSVVNLAEFQYGDIDIHDLEAVYSDAVDEADIEEVWEICGDDISGIASLYKTSVEYHTETATKSVYLVAAEENALDGYMKLSLLQGDETYPAYGEVFLSQKIAEVAGVNVGDDITLTDNEAGEVSLHVSGIYENYVWHYAIMTPRTYEEYFDKECSPNTLYINTVDDTAAYEAGAKLRQLPQIMNVMVVPEMKERVENMMKMMDAVVWLVIASAGALAFIVLFNLSNINITERVREIATIKVLGFYPRETGAYVFRENLVLTLMGIVVGLPLGVWLHSFVMQQIQVDMVAFKIAVMPISFVISVVIVLLFLKLVDVVMRGKIEAIDMAESLKSIE